MFNVGGGEVLVIALIALIVLGPQRLPDAARQVGKVMGDLRKLSSGFQSELRTAFEESEQQATATAPRDVLGVTATATPAPDATPEVARAVDSTTKPRPPRRTPLQAAPVPKAPRPRSKGS